ncbi:DUF6383 domain-containing protein [Parabacteroides sp. AF48-14]|uniref:DUF6383 domain-containing protein n=1 Tax=Parabacteroides sp. AF48-14 TaxID=2292052 RepID=UPI0011C4929B|nr:DUF6383 domain-containing protein [Parabacteroides sp. AF48-14]
MNRKISTFLAGIALLGAMSAGAQDVNTDIKLKPGKNNSLYQIAVKYGGTGSGVLTLNWEGKLTVTPYNQASSFWCVTVMNEDQGQNPKFDFLNRETGDYLDITMDEFEDSNTETTQAPAVGGEIGGWAFSNIFETGVENEKPLYSYFKADSIVGFMIDNTGKITLKKINARDLDATNFMTVSLQEVPAMQMTAYEINTKLFQQRDDAGVRLIFDPDRNNTTLENPFSDVEFLAYDNYIAGDCFVNIVRKSDGAALYVDTAYTNVNGAKFLAFKYIKEAGTHATPLDSLKANSFLKNQGAFLFTYYPSKDSLVIRVKQVIYEADAGTGHFADGTPSIIPDAAHGDDKYDANYVTVQDLIAQDEVRIVTVRDVKETDISLGLKGCDVTETKVSLEDGVYTIRNSKGLYLGVPIATLCDFGDYKTGWSSIDADVQDAFHMPAYQWVITKDRTAEHYLSTSMVSFVNREYPSIEPWRGIQLYEEGGDLYYYNNYGEKGILIFDKVPDEIISDPHLGYKYMSEEELMISNYAFNYYNALSDNKYIDILAGDSVLHILNEEQTFFSIDTVQGLGYSAEPYGIVVTDKLKARIPALVRLEKAPYHIYTTDADGKKAYVGFQDDFFENPRNLDERVIISPNVMIKTPFFFKENNHYKGKHYYAFLMGYPQPRPEIHEEFADDELPPLYVTYPYKVGVADQSSKALLQFQPTCENRTSSFSIGISEQPLYRRFNSLALEGNEGDAADTLRFVEKYRNEYLQMEVNPNFMSAGINFLGIDGAEKAKDGKSFYVDSVWVERGLGYIKPQYLVSIDRDGAKTTTIKIPCPLCQAEIEAGHDAPENCIHDKYVDIEGYERGHYLVNFADSTDNNYKWGKYSRVGFVDAIHMGDSLYLLIDQFAGVKTEDVDIAAIIEANKKKGGIKDGTGYYIKNLKGDAHKYYTWSFRFIDPTIAADEVESSRSFLFESMALNGKNQIAPEKASWLKMQNGCLVMSDPAASTFANAKTGGDDALIFNVEEGSKDDIATDNEVISVEGVNVIAKVGTVRVSGAEGKKVVITNILGQVVANTVITSSDATIAVPAGMVVVAVEGEEAVKAIVK